MSELKGNLFVNLAEAASRRRNLGVEVSGTDNADPVEEETTHSRRRRQVSSIRRINSNSSSHCDSDVESRSISLNNYKLKDYPLRSRSSGQWIPYREILKGNNVGEFMRNTFYNPSQYSPSKTKMPRKRKKLKVETSDSSVLSVGTESPLLTSKGVDDGNSAAASDGSSCTDSATHKTDQQHSVKVTTSSEDDDLTLQDLINLKKVQCDEQSKSEEQKLSDAENNDKAEIASEQYDIGGFEDVAPTVAEKGNSRLWCICKKPWDMRFMISCDRCREWYHGECVGITKDYGRILEMRNEAFVCSICKAKNEEEISKLLTNEQETTKHEKVSRKRKRRVVVLQSSSNDEDDNNNDDKNSVISSDESSEPKTNKSEVIGAAAATTSRVSSSSSFADSTAKRKSIRSRNKSVKQEITEPEKRYHCLITGCQNWASSNSVYCSEKCIQQHVDESLKILHRETEKNGKKSGLSIIEKSTGRILSGESAPSEDELFQFLCRHSTFEILKPGVYSRVLCSSDTTASKSAAYTNKVQNDVQKSSTSTTLSSTIGTYSSSKSVRSRDNDNSVSTSSNDLSTHKSKESTEKKILPLPTSSSSRNVNVEQQATIVPQKLDSLKSRLKSDDNDKVGGVSSERADTPSSLPIKRETKIEKPAPLNPMQIRINVRRTLRDFLKLRVENAKVPYKMEEIADIAVSIEDEMFKHFGDTGAKYKQRYRTLVQNIKDKRNNDFFMRIVTKEILPSQLMLISAEEMASNELIMKRKEQTQKEIESVLRAQKEAEQDMKLFRPLTVTKKDVFIKGDDDLSDLANFGDLSNKKPSSSVTVNPPTEVVAITPPPSAAPSPLAVNFPPLPPEVELPPLPSESPPLPSDALAKSMTSSSLPSVIVAPETSSDETYIPPESPPDESTSALYGENSVSAKWTKSTNPRPHVWKGFIQNNDTPRFLSTAYKLHGNFESISQKFPEKLVPCGRTVRDLVWEYVSKILNAPLRDFLIVYFLPASSDDKRGYASFFQVLNDKKKCAVLSIANQIIRDLYLVPLAKHESFPSFLSKANVKSLPPGHPDILLGLIITNSKKQVETEVHTSNPTIQQPISSSQSQSSVISTSIDNKILGNSGTNASSQPSPADVIPVTSASSKDNANAKSFIRDPRLRKTTLLKSTGDGTSSTSSSVAQSSGTASAAPLPTTSTPASSSMSSFTSSHIFIPTYPPPLMFNSVYVPRMFYTPDTTLPPPAAAFVPQKSAFWSPSSNVNGPAINTSASTLTNSALETSETVQSASILSEPDDESEKESAATVTEQQSLRLENANVAVDDENEADDEILLENNETINKSNLTETDRKLIESTVSEIMGCMEDRRIEDVTQISVRCLSMLSTDEAKQSFLAAFSEELKRLTDEIASVSAEMDEQESSTEDNVSSNNAKIMALSNDETELQDNLEHVNMDLDEVSTSDVAAAAVAVVAAGHLLFGGEDMDYRKDDIDIRQETLEHECRQEFSFPSDVFDLAAGSVSSSSDTILLYKDDSDARKESDESYEKLLHSTEEHMRENTDGHDNDKSALCRQESSTHLDEEGCICVSANDSQSTNENFHEVSSNTETKRTIGGGIRFRLADRSQRRVASKHFGHSRKEHDSYWDQDEYERDPEAFMRLLNYVSQYPSSVFSLENINLLFDSAQPYYGNLFKLQVTSNKESLPKMAESRKVVSTGWFSRSDETDDCDLRVTTPPTKKRLKPRGYVDLDKPND